MNRGHQTLKFIGIIGLIFLYGFNLVLLRIFYWRDEWGFRRAMQPFLKFWSKAGLWVLGIEVEKMGEAHSADQGTLFVANHLSYLDILVISAHSPACFVTSMEIKETIGLGSLTELGGCIYVERRSRENIKHEVAQITYALMRGINVMIFPEATSTNGERVLRFRSPLYNAATQISANVQPICINYRYIDDEPVSNVNRDQVFWYGEMDFLPHLWNLAACERVMVSLDYFDPISTTPPVQAQQLAEVTHSLICVHYCPVS